MTRKEGERCKMNHSSRTAVDATRRRRDVCFPDQRVSHNMTGGDARSPSQSMTVAPAKDRKLEWNGYELIVSLTLTAVALISIRALNTVSFIRLIFPTSPSVA